MFIEETTKNLGSSKKQFLPATMLIFNWKPFDLSQQGFYGGVKY